VPPEPSSVPVEWKRKFGTLKVKEAISAKDGGKDFGIFFWKKMLTTSAKKVLGRSKKYCFPVE
jgi:hypothetical protein